MGSFGASPDCTVFSELASGAAAITRIQEIESKEHKARGIPVKISTEFFKKSRGTITATSLVPQLTPGIKNLLVWYGMVSDCINLKY